MSNVGKRGKLSLRVRLRDALLKGTNSTIRHHEIREVIDALCKPQAREEAQPVAWVVRKGLSTGSLFYTERGQNADLPDGTLLYTTPPAPEAENLRVAVEALEKIKAVRVCRDSANIWTGADACRKIATEALAALQAETVEVLP